MTVCASTIALFGEAERGKFRAPHYIKALEELEFVLGEPPPESRGLFFAVQALLHQCHLIFIRVEEEGFSLEDYMVGIRLLENEDSFRISALAFPGVGNRTILDAATPICQSRKTLLLTSEKDLYDYLTER